MNEFNSLPKKTQKALREIGDCWRLVAGKKHIRIFVNDVMAGIMPKRKPGDGSSSDQRAELNIISQIRRAARGELSNRRSGLAPSL